MDTTVELLPGVVTESAGPAKYFEGLPVFTASTLQLCDGDWHEAVSERWAVCLFRDVDDPENWVTAEVIGVRGIASEGATREEAMGNIKEALLLARDEAGAEGLEIDRLEYRIPANGDVVHVTL